MLDKSQLNFSNFKQLDPLLMQIPTIIYIKLLKYVLKK